MTRLSSFPFGFLRRAWLMGLSLLLWLGGAAVSPAADTTNGLVGYWTFEEGTGTTTADQTTNGFTGTFENVATWGGPTWTNSPLGSKALSFDGVNDRINIGNPPALQLTGAMTLTAWIYVRQFNPNNGRIITKGGGSGSRGWALNVEGGSTPPNAGSFQVGGSPTATFGITTTTSLASKQWGHLAGVYVPGVASRIYINGLLNKEVTTAVPATQNNTTLNVAIGGRPTGSVDTPWNGLIDEVRVFNRALSAEEISALPELVPTPLTLVTQPVSRIVAELRSVTFSARASGSPPHYFQWLSNGVAIPDAVGPTYTIPSTTLAMNGTAFSVMVSNLAYSVTSSNAVLTVVQDSTPPEIIAVGSVGGRSVGVCFSEPMDPGTAGSFNLYMINDGAVLIANAVLRADGRSVLLTLDPLDQITGPFTLFVTDVTDLAGNPIAPDTAVNGTVTDLTPADVGGPLQAGSSFTCTPGALDLTAGGADFGGTADQGHVALKTVAGDFDVKVRVTGLTPVNSNAKAGLMARATVDAGSPTLHVLANPPPPTGRGWIEAGRRTVTDGSTVNWGTYTTGVMPDLWLRLRRAGDVFQAFHGTNGVAWTRLGQTSQLFAAPLLVGLAATARDNNVAPTLAEFREFGDLVFSGTSLSLTQAPTNRTVPQNSIATFAAAAVGQGAPADELIYQWQRGDGLGGFTNIFGANDTTLSFLARPEDQNAQFRVRVDFTGLTETSVPATLTVTSDAILPEIVSVRARGNPNQVVLVFSEAVSGSSATDTLNYTLVERDSGAAVVIGSATLDADGRTVTLTTDALVEGPMYRLMVDGVEDLAVPPNAVAVDTQVEFTYSSLVGYWAFDEGTGTTAADQSGLGNHGTLANGPLWVPGQIGSFALNFDGVDDSVNLGNPAVMQITGPLTLTAWVYPDTFTASGRIISKGSQSGFRGWALNVESANTWAFRIGTSPSANVAVTVTPVITTAWTHLAGVYDPTVPILRLYTNGVLAGELTAGVPTSQFNPSAGVFIGRRNDGLFFDGRIDEVRIYTRALSGEAVLALATVPPQFLSPTLSGGQIHLDWTGTGRLEWAPTVLGPWTPTTPVPAAPYSEAVVTATNRFFRLNATP